MQLDSQQQCKTQLVEKKLQGILERYILIKCHPLWVRVYSWLLFTFTVLYLVHVVMTFLCRCCIIFYLASCYLSKKPDCICCLEFSQ